VRHPGELHNLLDLSRTPWGRPLDARSLLVSDMLFRTGSFDLFASGWGNGLPPEALENMARDDAGLYGDATPVSTPRAALATMGTPAVLSCRAALRDACLMSSLPCEDDQFFSFPFPEEVPLDARFTRDEFDQELSLTMASLQRHQRTHRRFAHVLNKWSSSVASCATCSRGVRCAAYTRAFAAEGASSACPLMRRMMRDPLKRKRSM